MSHPAVEFMCVGPAGAGIALIIQLASTPSSLLCWWWQGHNKWMVMVMILVVVWWWFNEALIVLHVSFTPTKLHSYLSLSFCGNHFCPHPNHSYHLIALITLILFTFFLQLCSLLLVHQSKQCTLCLVELGFVSSKSGKAHCTPYVICYLDLGAAKKNSQSLEDIQVGYISQK